MHTNSLPPSDRDLSDASDPSDSPRSDAHHQSIAVINRARNQVSGEIVFKATANLPDNQRSAIRRFHAFYTENALTLDEAGKLIRCAGSSLSQVFNGQYGAKLDSMVDEIESFFELHDRRNFGRKLEFIEFSVSRRIFQVCEGALEFQKIALLLGDQQVGKTTAVKEFARRHNHGNTVYVYCPAGGRLRDFLVSAASALRINPRQKPAYLRRAIKDSFDNRMLLIVDELHHTVDAQAKASSIETVEFIREIHDERECGLVGVATNVFRDEMEQGDLARLMRQFKRRRIYSHQLPAVPTQEDLNTFAAAYGLKPATGDAKKLQTDMIEHEALGMWLTLLRMASKLAAKAKVKMDWAHVISAHKGLLALEGGVA